MKNYYDKLQKAKIGKLLGALMSLGLSYLFFNLSFNQGSFWYYLLTLIFFVYFLKFSFRFFGDIYHEYFG